MFFKLKRLHPPLFVFFFSPFFTPRPGARATEEPGPGTHLVLAADQEDDQDQASAQTELRQSRGHGKSVGPVRYPQSRGRDPYGAGCPDIRLRCQGDSSTAPQEKIGGSAWESNPRFEHSV